MIWSANTLKDQAIRTLPGLLQRLLISCPTSGAFNYREAGYWRHLSTEEFCGEVRRFALGLHHLGLRRGESVCLLAPSSPHWLIADLAIMSLGAITVPLFPNLSAEHFLYEADNVDARMLIVIGEDQWRLAEPYSPRFRSVIARNVLDHGRAVGWRDVIEFGDTVSRKDPTLYRRLLDTVQASDTATIIHTSGSTGSPKGVMLTHTNLLTQVDAALICYPLTIGRDRALSCLPLAHVFERMVAYTYLAAGIPLYFADDVKNVGQLMREVKPTVMTMVPRLIEKLYARIAKGIDGAWLPRRQLGEWALNKARSGDPERVHGIGTGIADTMVYRKIRAALGGEMKYLIVGGAALATDLARFLSNVGVPVFIGYGLTEASPVVASNCPGATRIGTVGKPFPGVEVDFGANEEILVKGPGVMRGYHRDATASAVAIDTNGWLHTGDCGHFDADGFLIITGRVKELLKTSNGKYVCPIPIEQALTSSNLIDLAMVVAEGRSFVSALLFPDFDYLHQIKERQGCGNLSDDEFLASPGVRGEMNELLTTINGKLDRWEQVRSYRFVVTVPSVQDELTPTMKLRRHVVASKYHDLIDTMYQETDI